MKLARELFKKQALKEIDSYLVFIGSIYDRALMIQAMQLFINKRRGTSKKRPSKLENNSPKAKKLTVAVNKKKSLSKLAKAAVISPVKNAITVALRDRLKSGTSC